MSEAGQAVASARPRNSSTAAWACVAMPSRSPAATSVVFFVRYDGKPYGYLNRCAHVPMELDWSEGQFFESSGLYLMCATHGAIYAPDTGKCVGGPCRGARLRPVQVEERDTPEGRAVFWLPDDDAPSRLTHSPCLFTHLQTPTRRRMSDQFRPIRSPLSNRVPRRRPAKTGSAPRSSASRSRRSTNSAPRAAGRSSSASCFCRVAR